jgi:hypothetical protein
MAKQEENLLNYKKILLGSIAERSTSRQVPNDQEELMGLAHPFNHPPVRPPFC